MRTSETITKIAPALLKAQRAIGGKVEKGAANPFFKSRYADLNAVLEATVPHFNDNGITVLQPTVVLDGKNFVETILLHESGEFVASLTEIKVSKANDAQAEGSGISYARRYGLQSFANLAAVDDDGETSIGRGANKATVNVELAKQEVAKKSVVEEVKASKTTKFAPKKVVQATTSAVSSDDLDL